MTSIEAVEAVEAVEPPEQQLRHRLLGYRPTDRFWGWAVPVLMAAIGGFVRFRQLNRPHELVFDETYYVKEAASYLKVGYELAVDPNSTPKPDELFSRGTTDVFLNTPDFVVHPPVGKWMIAFGQMLFGGPVSSWGWRFSAALVGTLSILMIGRIARRLFGSTLLGGVAALLLAVDGEHFVLSRTGLLDIFVMFWALAGFGCILIDRDRSRARLARRLAQAQNPGSFTGDNFLVRPYAVEPPVFGPWLGIRWWRLAAAVCLGLAAGVKWSGLFFLAAFALASVLWDIAARRAAGIRHWFLSGVLVDGVQAALTVLPVALVTYVASWTGWIRTQGGSYRQWGAQHPSRDYGWIPDALRSLWRYHQEMFHFNTTLSSPHVYQSNPWSWSVLGRPTAFYYVSIKDGAGGCTVDECSRAIIDLGNPVVWWGGTLAIAVLLFSWLLGRDWRAGAVLAGLAGGYLPWFFFQGRTIYTFYAVAFVPWIVLGLTFALGLLLGRRDASPTRRLYGSIGAGAVVTLAVLAFAFFYPVLSAQVIPHSDWSARMWLPSWV